jgi:hypothetical protein
MNTNTTRRFARFALPVVTAGIIGGAALGLAGAANAGTYSQDQTPQPSIIATPTVTAHPAPEIAPGPHPHGIPHLETLVPGYTR